jgi:hypothetical protein
MAASKKIREIEGTLKTFDEIERDIGAGECDGLRAEMQFQLFEERDRVLGKIADLEDELCAVNSRIEESSPGGQLKAKIVKDCEGDPGHLRLVREIRFNQLTEGARQHPDILDLAAAEQRWNEVREGGLWGLSTRIFD